MCVGCGEYRIVRSQYTIPSSKWIMDNNAHQIEAAPVGGVLVRVRLALLGFCGVPIQILITDTLISQFDV